MNSLALGLVLAAAVFHAGWNRLFHDVQDRVATIAVAGMTGFVLLLPATITAPPTGAGVLVGLSAVAETAYALALAAAYRRGALSLAYPIGRGTAPLLVTLGGWIALTQTPAPATVVGAGALALGLVLVASTASAANQQAAVGFAVLTGCCIALYSVVDARAVQHVSPAGYLGVVLGLQAILLTIGMRGNLSRLRACLRPGILIGLGTVGAYLLVLLAFQRASAGRVATVREVSVLIGLLISCDRPGPRTWLGGALVVAGAIAAAA